MSELSNRVRLFRAEDMLEEGLRSMTDHEWAKLRIAAAQAEALIVIAKELAEIAALMDER